MTDKIKVLPTVKKKEVSGVEKLLEDFKQQIKNKEGMSNCIIISFGADGTNPLISYGLTKDLPLFEAIGVLEYMKQELTLGGEG
tara:strand:+ start:120 stop:371 length:252 start_codon:yes stop_codon:yes gene_type:complete